MRGYAVLCDCISQFTSPIPIPEPFSTVLFPSIVMSALLNVKSHPDRVLTERWADLEEDDTVSTSTPLSAVSTPVGLVEEPVVTCVREEGWEVQGRKQKQNLIKQEACHRKLMVFACLPFSNRLLYRGMANGLQGLLEVVERKGFKHFHGYDPVSQQLIWKKNVHDQTVGMQSADRNYVFRVEKLFKNEINSLKKSGVSA